MTRAAAPIAAAATAAALAGVLAATTGMPSAAVTLAVAAALASIAAPSPALVAAAVAVLIVSRPGSASGVGGAAAAILVVLLAAATAALATLSGRAPVWWRGRGRRRTLVSVLAGIAGGATAATALAPATAGSVLAVLRSPGSWPAALGTALIVAVGAVVGALVVAGSPAAVRSGSRTPALARIATAVRSALSPRLGETPADAADGASTSGTLDAADTTGPDGPPSARAVAQDAALALATTLVAAASLSSTAPTTVAAALALGAAVAARRLAPGASLALAWAGVALQVVAGSTVIPADVVVLVVLYSSAAYGSSRVRRAGLVSAGAGALVAAVLLGRAGITQHALDALLSGGGLGWHAALLVAVGGALVLGGAWLVGFSVRSSRRQAAALRARAAAERDRAAADAERRRAERENAEEAERGRIARDMHDVVAHSLAVVIAQADGARYAARVDPALAEQALTTIAGAARDALGDVRGLLARLRYEQGDAPQPGLDDLEALLAQLTASGLVLRRTESGERPAMSAAVQLALYRIVQESLVNALRHGARGGAVDLVLRWAPAGLELEVVNPMPGTAGAGADATRPSGAREAGHGLTGIRERALLAGGDSSAGVAADGRWHLSARLPSAAPPPAPAPTPTPEPSETERTRA